MRKNNLELRKYSGSKKTFEIVKITLNPYFQQEEKYQKEGSFYFNENNVSIHESFFLNSENCYTIVFIEDGIVNFIGDRAIELETVQEMKNFLFLLRSGIKKSLQYKLKEEK